VGTTRKFRFRDYTTRPDPLSVPTHAAECVTGEDADCGASSGRRTTPEEVVKWIAEHCRDTSHVHFERTEHASVIAVPGEWHFRCPAGSARTALQVAA
jgi:hypothetical protein